jgi:cytochrome c556
MLSKLPWDAFLYPASDRGQTKLNSKALKNKDDFMQAARKLENETAKLAAAAKTGDLDAVKAQFGATAQTCKGCHGEFKSR